MLGYLLDDVLQLLLELGSTMRNMSTVSWTEPSAFMIFDVDVVVDEVGHYQ